jgi:hypothetical protein
MKKFDETNHPLMDENYYWKTVDASIKYSNDQNQQLSFLMTELKQMPLDDIVGFMMRMNQIQQDLYTSQLCCACFLLNKGYCSVDGFEYFISWIISNGKDTYDKARNIADSLACKINPKTEFYYFEEFGYAPSYAFTNKTSGKDIFAYLGENFSFPELPKIKFNWNTENPDTMQSICPILFEKMWSKNVHNPNNNLVIGNQTTKKSEYEYRRKHK